MKAILLREFGAIDQMYMGEVPTPELSDGEVLVKVDAAALNRADILQRKGFYPPPPGCSEILGLEVAGEVVATTSATQKWQGVKVMALLSGGGYAEFVAVHASLLIKIPDILEPDQAAGVMEAFLTGWQALTWLGNLQSSENVLIHAGASGVGSACIQLAKELGAQVVVTASGPKHEFCFSLGADHCIDYRNDDFSKLIRNYLSDGADLIIDFIGAPYFNTNLNSLAKDGRLVMLGFLGGTKLDGVNLQSILAKRITVKGSTLRSRSLSYRGKLVEDFERSCYANLESGSLKPVIDRVFPWEEVGSAHKYMEANRNQGKVILRIT